ncbi:MAG: hypothetical protein NT051_04205, partial [Candidatus Micrarchaeota archaeon]|nr:hypothetical protein [Candidatus Micrarchaeota archaeon]
PQPESPTPGKIGNGNGQVQTPSPELNPQPEPPIGSNQKPGKEGINQLNPQPEPPAPQKGIFEAIFSFIASLFGMKQ